MAKALHLTVTGEGVETAEQLALLRAWDCERGQGFLFAGPLDAAETHGDASDKANIREPPAGGMTVPSAANAHSYEPLAKFSERGELCDLRRADCLGLRSAPA